MDALVVDGLAAGYKGEDVFKEISFSVERGGMLGIVGPNGSGKTTLLRAMTRVLKPSKGRVLMDGVDIYKIPLRELARRMTVIPQLIESPFSFTVEEFVRMGRFPYSGTIRGLGEHDIRLVNEALDFTDMGALKDRKLNELSGGERQRAVLAQGFAQEPELLILDEPTAHLDITHQVRILDLIKRLNKEKGLSIIMILHNLNLASEYCDGIMMLDKGSVAASGTPHDVLTYANIEKVYKTIVVVEKNPISGRPHILLVPGR